MAYTKEDREDAIYRLHEILKPGDTVYTVLRHVSKSGMQRVIDAYTIRDNRMVYLSGYAAKALGYRRSTGNHYGLVINGCGMDMGFEIVYNLGRVLFKDGGPADKSQRCGKAGDTETDGGYLLRHEWI